MTDWPHAPVHRLLQPGTYMVTTGTYLKRRLLCTAERLQLVQDALFRFAGEYGWGLQAWSVLSNHYHFVAVSSDDPKSLVSLLRRLHRNTATALNRMDGAMGRHVWFQYWDTELTFPLSYFARLNYVHNNPVHHGVVKVATEYRWCSAAWFEREADPAFQEVVKSFKTDRVNVPDDF